MGEVLGVFCGSSLIGILPQFLQWYVQYHMHQYMLFKIGV